MYRSTGVIKAADIARRQNIPHKFLEQILILLKGAGIVVSRRGAKGGYSLARPASEISLASIVRLTEESLMSSYEGMERESPCPFGEVWKDIDRYVEERLESAKIQDICDRREAIAWVPEYTI